MLCTIPGELCSFSLSDDACEIVSESSFSDDTVSPLSDDARLLQDIAYDNNALFPDPELVERAFLREEARWPAAEQLERAAALRKDVRFVEEEQEDQPAAAASLHPSLMFLCFNVFLESVLFSVAPSTPHHPMLGAVRGVE